jgi:hypothetical protein
VAEDSATFDNFWKSLNPQNQEEKNAHQIITSSKKQQRQQAEA